jgi:hypothetical protein
MATPPAVERGRCHDVYTPIIIDALLFLTITNRFPANHFVFPAPHLLFPYSVLRKTYPTFLPPQTMYIIQPIESSQTAVASYPRKSTEISQNHIDFLF